MTTHSPFPRTTPEAQGIPSTAILNVVHAVEQHTHPLDALHSFMLVRHGNVVAEGWWAPYERDAQHTLYSVSKSFTSTAIGLAIHEGLLTLDDPVVSFFPDNAPINHSDNLLAMRVRHLLSMNTGHQNDTTLQVIHGSDDNWATSFLSLPVEHRPGTWFAYDTSASYMLSAIITKLTDQSLLDYLRPRLFDPLGIKHPTWESDPRGVNIGGYGLHITTEDLACFGQLYLQKGIWQGTRILPAEWIAEATSTISDNSNTPHFPDWTVGYGYQFWRCRHNCYRADGVFGQFCIVMPDQDAVLAITGGLFDSPAVLDTVWEHLLPAMMDHPLPADREAQDALQEKLTALTLPLPRGATSSSSMTRWSGQTYRLEPNAHNVEHLTIIFGDDCSTLIVHDTRGEHRIQIGHATWLNTATDFYGLNEQPVATSSAWTSTDTFQVHLCFTKGEVGLVLTFSYLDDELLFALAPNVAWGSTTTTVITGIATNSAS